MLKGRVDSVSKLNGVVVSIESPPSPTGWVAMPWIAGILLVHPGDKRDFKGPGRRNLLKRSATPCHRCIFPIPESYLSYVHALARLLEFDTARRASSESAAVLPFSLFRVLRFEWLGQYVTAFRLQIVRILNF